MEVGKPVDMTEVALRLLLSLEALVSSAGVISETCVAAVREMKGR